MEISEIRSWETYITTERHSARLKEQNIDQTFFEDTYEIPHIQDEDYIMKTGFISELENSVTPQMIAFEPKAYTEARNERTQNGADRVAKELNRQSNILSRYSIHPFRQTFKWLAFTRGEAWIYTPHNNYITSWNQNEDWRDIYPSILPVHFILYDPMVVFHDPSEEVDGKPPRLIVKYDMKVGDVKALYPNWTNPHHHKDSDMVPYMLFFDKETRYLEIDKEAGFRYLAGKNKGKFVNGDGRHSNPYGGIIPFTHRYSGYGTQDQKLNPALLAHTRTRMIRDRVKEDAAMAADFRYNQHEQAWPRTEIIWPLDTPVPEDLLSEYSRDPDTVSILKAPPGVKPEVNKSEAFGAEAYAYRDRVKSDLMGAMPLPLKGVASGTSGRQEDVLTAFALSMYDPPLNACSLMWAEAFDNAIKICSLPKLDILPKGLMENDYKSYSEIKLNLKHESEQELSRRAAEGDQRYKMGLIDFVEHAIVYQGKTKEEALRLKARVTIDNAMRNHPAFMQMIMQRVAEKIGSGEEFKRISEMLGGEKAINKVPEIGSRGGGERLGNIQSVYGAEGNTRHEARMPAGM